MIEKLKNEIQKQLNETGTVTGELKAEIFKTGNIRLICMLAEDNKYKGKIEVIKNKTRD